MKEEKKNDVIERNEYIKEMLKEGLSVDACVELYKNKKKRDRAIERNETETSPMRRGYNNKIIRECDKQEKKIKADDWKENNPKQYAVYYITEVNDMYNKMISEPDEEKRKELLKKINDFQDENDEWREKHKEIYEETKAQIFDDTPSNENKIENNTKAQIFDDTPSNENKIDDNANKQSELEKIDEKASNEEKTETKEEVKEDKIKDDGKKFLAINERDR